MDLQRQSTSAAALMSATTMGFHTNADALDQARRQIPQVSTPTPAPRASPPAAHINTPQPALADPASRTAFDAWRARHAGAPTPLDALSPGGRERVIDGLTFLDGRPVGVDGVDLSAELRQQQVDAVLAWLLPALGHGALANRRARWE